MTILHRIMIAFVTVAMLTMGAARAASTTNFSDYWWTENESGWGMSVQQQADVLFINLSVYGVDNRPTWFTAAAYKQDNAASGHAVFTGDLYLTTGAYYASTWNPAALGYRKVGTLTFDAIIGNDASSGNNATLTYTVDGTPVVENVTRFILGYENLTGKYYGGWHRECTTGPAPFGVLDEPVTIEISHNADNSLTMTVWDVDLLLGGFYLRGAYSQSGHMGQINAQVLSPDRGTVTFFEIEKTVSGFTGRFVGSINDCQITNGRIGGIRR